MRDPFAGEHEPRAFVCLRCHAPTRPVLRFISTEGVVVGAGRLQYQPADLLVFYQRCDSCSRLTALDLSVPCDPVYWPISRATEDL